MKKILILILIFNLTSYSQTNDDSITYSAESMIQIITNEKGQVISEMPCGKNIFISYDTFFKSYYITYYDDENSYCAMKLKFISNRSDGSTRTYDTFNKIYIVKNFLEENGKILLLMEKKIEDKYASFLITNAKKI